MWLLRESLHGEFLYKWQFESFRKFFNVCSLFEYEWLRADMKLTFHQGLQRPRPVPPGNIQHPPTKFLNLQGLQVKVICTTGQFDRPRQIREWNVTFIYPYLYKLRKIMCLERWGHTKPHVLECLQLWTRRSPTQKKKTIKSCSWQRSEACDSWDG